jgi:chromosome segregation ATPase
MLQRLWLVFLAVLTASDCRCRLAEAQAKAETLSRQIETERSHYEQKCESLRIEVQALKSSLAQEQGERARLLSQMRGMIQAPGKKKQSAVAGGGGEAVSDGRMMELQEEAAREKAGRERAEAQAATWRSEARLMRDKAQAMEASRNDLVAKIQVSNVGERDLDEGWIC